MEGVSSLWSGLSPTLGRYPVSWYVHYCRRGREECNGHCFLHKKFFVPQIFCPSPPPPFSLLPPHNWFVLLSHAVLYMWILPISINTWQVQGVKAQGCVVQAFCVMYFKITRIALWKLIIISMKCSLSEEERGLSEFQLDMMHCS